MSRYVLPDLPYDYGALEPHVSGKIMELHHDKHHRTYVTAANQAIERLMEARQTGNFEQVGALQRSLAFNVSGHVLQPVTSRRRAPLRRAG
jgi:superoxide dismutase, Fe-Mn family